MARSKDNGKFLGRMLLVSVRRRGRSLCGKLGESVGWCCFLEACWYLFFFLGMYDLVDNVLIEGTSFVGPLMLVDCSPLPACPLQ